MSRSGINPEALANLSGVVPPHVRAGVGGSDLNSGTPTASGKDHSDLTTKRLSTVDDATTCERCAMLEGLLRQAEEDMAELGRQRAGLEHNLRRAASAEQVLRRELEQHREEDPKSQDARQLLDYWKRQLNHPKAKTPLTGKRAKFVLKALRTGYGPAQIRQAIDGLAKLPYVGAGGRRATGKPHELYDDVEHALRDEATIERFIRYATTPAPSHALSSVPAVERLLERLDAVKQTGPGQWLARCPAHDDRQPSLSVAQGDKGAVATCHAGCTPQDIADAAGVALAEWFDVEPAPFIAKALAPLPTDATLESWTAWLLAHTRLLERLREVRGWTTATLARLGVGWDGERIVFPIRDGHGKLVTVARYLPTGSPKMLGLHGRERGLFPAPETVDGQVWLVEGEPDAVTGHEIGLGAVGVPGVNGWRSAMPPRFAGRDVVVCMDADKPGRAAAAKIAQELAGIATRVRVVDIDADRDDGYDLTDAVREGANFEILTALADLRLVA